MTDHTAINDTTQVTLILNSIREGKMSSHAVEDNNQSETEWLRMALLKNNAEQSARENRKEILWMFAFALLSIVAAVFSVVIIGRTGMRDDLGLSLLFVSVNMLAAYGGAHIASAIASF